MRSPSRPLAVLLALALPSVALAAEPNSPPAAGAPAAFADPDPAYEEAVEALRAQRWGQGTRLLDRYLERADAPHRAEAVALRDLARRFAALEAGQLDQRGRAELAVFSTLYGVWAGGLVDYLGGDFGDDDLLIDTTLFAGLGLTAALVATSGREITEGRARLVSMGGFWGTLNAAAFAPQAGIVQEQLATTMLAAGLGGIALGATVLDEAPDPGYLSLVNTVGLWSGYATGMLLVVLESNAEAEDNFALIVGGADLGLLITAAAARDVRISQGRVHLIDLGGLLGTLGAASVLVTTDVDSASSAGALMLGGTTAGLVLATLATRDWDDPPGGELRSGLEWRGPGIALIPGTDGKSVALGANLASGRF